MEVIHDPEHTRFFIAADGGVAELVYNRMDEHTLELVHTGVSPALGHHGMGDALAKAAFAYAHANDIHVILTCPFLRRWILSHPEERDIVTRQSDEQERH
ncbi:MAG: N-acetyltransferase [bacterium]